MTLEQTQRWRERTGRAVAIFIVLMFVALFDALIAKFRQPPNLVELLPGSTVQVNGPLAVEEYNPQSLTYTPTSEDVHLIFEEIHHGFWLGGLMWRGRLTVSPQISPGEYRLTIGVKGRASPKPAPILLVKVYPDLKSWHKNSRSLLRRHTGLSPWVLFVVLLSLAALSLGMVYYLSSRIAQLLAQGGKAEIYMVKQGEVWTVIAFGLGRRHGLQPGAQLGLCDAAGRPVGTATVQEVTDTDALAFTSPDSEVRPGYFVSMR